MFYSSAVSTPSRRAVHVKGSAFHVRIAWLRLAQGGAVVDRIQAEVGDDVARLIEQGAARADWYPLAWFIELNQAIDRVVGRGDLTMVKELGRHAAEAQLTTIYRLFIKLGTITWILARAARLWNLHFDSGRLLLREFPDGQLEVEILDFAAPHRVHCLAVQGWVERAIELSGARDVELTEVDCRALGHDRCRFRLRWS
jgi:hypothetical protein